MPAWTRSNRSGEGRRVLVVVVAIAKAAVVVASATFGDGGSGAAVIGATGAVVAALLMLVGVVVRRGNVVAGSWLITIGAFVGLDPVAPPVAALVVISGVVDRQPPIQRPTP